MCEIEEKSVEIKVTEKFATDENGEDQYRYVLIKEWGQADKPVVVIMYNPSDADYLMYDKTVMNVENYFKKKKFNKIIILNLFAIKGKNSSIVSKANQKYENKNKEYIGNYIKESDDIYLAWGYGKAGKSQKIKDKIKEIEKLVYTEKINTIQQVRSFADEGQVNVKCHPQNMNIDTWTDIEYDFSHLKGNKS